MCSLNIIKLRKSDMYLVIVESLGIINSELELVGSARLKV